jgi:hypothetical protein
MAFAADWTGKLKMFVQSAGIPTVLFITVNPGCLASADWRTAQDIAAWTMALVTLGSAVPYALRGAALLRSISKGTR